MNGTFGRGWCEGRVQGTAGGVKRWKSSTDCSSSTVMGGSAWAGGACPYEGGRRRQCPFSCKKDSSMAGRLLCGSGKLAGCGREGGCLAGETSHSQIFLQASTVQQWSVNCCCAVSPFAPLMMSPVSAASGRCVWTGEAAMPHTALGWPQAPLGTAFPVVVVPVQSCSAIPVLHLPTFPELLSQK